MCGGDQRSNALEQQRVLLGAAAHRARRALDGGATVDDILKNEVVEKVSRARYVPEDEFEAYKASALKELDSAFAVPA